MDQGFYVDVRHILLAFDPMTSYNYYYMTNPKLRHVVAEVTIERIIECVFVVSAQSLQENGLTSILYEYMEHQCEKAMSLFEADADLVFNFDLLVNDIVEVTDSLLRHMLSRYTDSYEHYVFDHWAARALGVFLREDHGS